MAAKMILAVFAACVCVAYAGNIATPIASYAAGLNYAHTPIAAPIATPIASYAAGLTYAHTPVAAPVVYVDNTHFSYGYINPGGNGRVDVARNGPVGSLSYNFVA